jgi:hypothetical protein
MAIKPAKELLDMYVVKNCMLAASITYKIGDAVIINTAVPQTVTTNGTNTTAAVFGTILAIKNGPANGSTYLQKDTVTTLSTNVTVDQISADILLSNNLSTLVADVDANLGTTTNSQYFGYFTMKSGTPGTLLESSYSTTAASHQFLSFGAVPGSLTQVFGIWNTTGRI